MLVRMERYGSRLPLDEPADNVAGCWPRKRLVAVMAHEPNYWVTYRRVDNQWWLLDSGTPSRIIRRKPFCHQSRHTIDMLFFM